VRKKCRCLDDVGPPRRGQTSCARALMSKLPRSIEQAGHYSVFSAQQHASPPRMHQAMVVALTCLSVSSRVSAIADGWLDVSIMWYTAFMPCKSHTSMELCIQASAVVALFSSRVGTHGRIFHHRLLVGLGLLATGAG
jgi:hypothetical protein